MLIVVPKGRLLKDVKNILLDIGISFDDSSRKLILDTSVKNLKIAILRSWDIPKFVNKGIAEIGFVGKDVLNETDDKENFYERLDLKFGKCRLSLAALNKVSDSNKPIIATKYIKSAKEFFSSKLQNVEIIKLKGAIEIAPILGLSDYIVDLVQSGKTLKENGLSELEIIQNISTRLIVNKSAFKTNNKMIERIVFDIEEVLNGKYKN
ncbi:MAG: ATP phosphoribosyltransferase [Gammaproteobacteria bacterium]|nr:MAG: ATP phosphoribosyltransferase [Gammaproteobacteria bacterium]|tara:strand:- start:235 stop:858 length:624 start_codon:yes stop_codon:yes gene_type:complete